MKQLDEDICYNALVARDRRFDGRFYTAVLTTGIFCRPICPAITPKRRNVRFFPTAEAAIAHRFRPCLRCRPEVTPGSPAAEGVHATVRRAVHLIEDGVLETGSTEDLATRLGIGARHLRRLFKEHTGVTPREHASARRLMRALSGRMPHSTCGRPLTAEENAPRSANHKKIQEHHTQFLYVKAAESWKNKGLGRG